MRNFDIGLREHGTKLRVTTKDGKPDTINVFDKLLKGTISLPQSKQDLHDLVDTIPDNAVFPRVRECFCTLWKDVKNHELGRHVVPYNDTTSGKHPVIKWIVTGMDLARRSEIRQENKPESVKSEINLARRILMKMQDKGKATGINVHNDADVLSWYESWLEKMAAMTE